MSMELLKSVKRRTLLGEIGYYGLNIGLAAVLFVMVLTIQDPLSAMVLVLLSKWRVFAVRPRFWLTNVQSNMVDLIVGLSIVALMYAPHVVSAQSSVSLWVQAALAIFYAAWLVVIKPMSKAWQMKMQSAIAMFFGMTALFVVSYEWPIALVVIMAGIVGYSTSRHILLTHEEDQVVFLSLIWAVVIAELSWLVHYWTFSYPLLGVPVLRIPQGTIIVMLASFLAERTYASWKKHGKVVKSDILAPAALSGSFILIMILFFNSTVQ